jgi:hypothetical protein
VLPIVFDSLNPISLNFPLFFLIFPQSHFLSACISQFLANASTVFPHFPFSSFNHRHQRVLARSQGNLSILVNDDDHDDEEAGTAAADRRSNSVMQRSSHHFSSSSSSSSSGMTKDAVIVEKITIQRTKSNPHLAKQSKAVFPPAAAASQQENEDHHLNNSNNGHDNHQHSDELMLSASAAAAATTADTDEDESDGDRQVNLSQLLGRKIRSSLIAQWESKIQQEIQSTS